MVTRTAFVAIGMLAIGLCLPASAVAQDIRVPSPAEPWRALDFGKPKTVAAPDVWREKNEWRAPLLRHAGPYVPFYELFRRSVGSASQPVTCAPATHHPEANWFAPALPPLPAVQTVQPFLGHHQRSPLFEPVTSPCKGR